MPSQPLLNQRQVQAALACVRELTHVSGVTDFHHHVTRATRGLLGDGLIASERYDLTPLRCLDGEAPGVSDHFYEVFLAYAHTHPFFGAMESYAYSRRILTIPSVMGDTKRFQELPLYFELYRHIHVVDQAAITFRGEQGEFFLLAFSRDVLYRPSDIAVLEMIRPHLISSYFNWLALQRLGGERQWLLDGLEELGSALMLLSPSGKVERWTPLAVQLLGKYFPKARCAPGRLPARLLRWIQPAIRDQSKPLIPPPPLKVGSQADALTIRLIQAPRQSGYLMILEESLTQAGPQVLQHQFGLTPQRSKALYLLTKGLNNRQIADAMGLKTGTVRKHLEYVYRQLNVSSRTEAAAVATRGSR